MHAIALGYPPLKSATSLQGPSLLVKTLKKSATSPQQLRNIATSQLRNNPATRFWPGCWRTPTFESDLAVHISPQSNSMIANKKRNVKKRIVSTFWSLGGA